MNKATLYAGVGDVLGLLVVMGPPNQSVTVPVEVDVLNQVKMSVNYDLDVVPKPSPACRAARFVTEDLRRYVKDDLVDLVRGYVDMAKAERFLREYNQQDHPLREVVPDALELMEQGMMVSGGPFFSLRAKGDGTSYSVAPAFGVMRYYYGFREGDLDKEEDACMWHDFTPGLFFEVGGGLGLLEHPRFDWCGEDYTRHYSSGLLQRVGAVFESSKAANVEDFKREFWKHAVPLPFERSDRQKDALFDKLSAALGLACYSYDKTVSQIDTSQLKREEYGLHPHARETQEQCLVICRAGKNKDWAKVPDGETFHLVVARDGLGATYSLTDLALTVTLPEFFEGKPVDVVFGKPVGL